MGEGLQGRGGELCGPRVEVAGVGGSFGKELTDKTGVVELDRGPFY